MTARQAQVVGAEVVAPLASRSAPRRRRTARSCGCAIAVRKARRGEALGRGEADLRAAVADRVERGAVVAVAAEASITAGWPRSVSRAHWSRISAISGETTTVRSVAGERGQLVAEALAAAGRHDDERVAPVERGLDGLALAGAEAR